MDLSFVGHRNFITLAQSHYLTFYMCSLSLLPSLKVLDLARRKLSEGVRNGLEANYWVEQIPHARHCVIRSFSCGRYPSCRYGGIEDYGRR